MPIGTRGRNYLDGDVCFAAWLQGRTVDHALKILESQGVTNPRTGAAPTRMGVWSAAVRWALNEPEQAYAMASKQYENPDWSYEDFLQWLVPIARTAFSSLNQYSEILFENGWEKYIADQEYVDALRQQYEQSK